MANQAYSTSARFAVAEVVEALRRFVARTSHQFWADDISLRDGIRFRTERIHGPKQLTDFYLLALAVEHGGRLATFDRTIPSSAIAHAEAKHICVI